MPQLSILDISGSPYELGYAHGQAYADAIRHLADERVALAGSGTWSERPLSRDEVLALADACVDEHEQYAPDLMVELRGMADATGLSLAELIIVNGFTDFVDTIYAVTRRGGAVVEGGSADNCTAFIIPDSLAADGRGYFGQTWDMHDSATPFVRLLRVRPDGGPTALLFTLTGCVGMVGMNDAGIAVGINNLLGGDGQVGVTWPFVVRKILQQTTIEAALACLAEARLAGAHNYLVYDATDSGYNIEAMSTVRHITRLKADAIVHTNHCLVPATRAVDRPRLPASQAHSEERLTSAQRLLDRDGITVDDLMALTRAPHICVSAEPPLFVETCGAAIMQPRSGRFWALWGRPTENEYELFSVS